MGFHIKVLLIAKLSIYYETRLKSFVWYVLSSDPTLISIYVAELKIIYLSLCRHFHRSEVNINCIHLESPMITFSLFLGHLLLVTVAL